MTEESPGPPRPAPAPARGPLAPPRTTQPITLGPIVPDYRWEDWVAFVATGLMVIAGAALPWYYGGAFPPVRSWITFEDPGSIVTAFAGAALFVLLIRLKGPSTAHVRSFAMRLLGGAGLLATVYNAYIEYRYHAELHPELGVQGHLGYLGIGLWLGLLACAIVLWTGIPTTRPPPHRPAPRPHPDLTLQPWMRATVPLLVFAVAFGGYMINIEHPAIVDFDEAHYVRVAINMTRGEWMDAGWGQEHPRPHNFEHPPVGKYMIALGYNVYGRPHHDRDWGQLKDLCDTDNPDDCAEAARSWRFGSALAGALGVVGMYWLGQRLFRSVPVGLAASAFLLTDGLYYLHSRIAMLDIFPIAFGLFAFGLYLGPRAWHKWLGSAFIGVAVASKLSALFLIPPFMALVFLQSQHLDWWMRLRDALIRGLILPFAIYVLLYAPFWQEWWQANPTGSTLDRLGASVEDFVYVHTEGYRWLYRAQVDQPHPYFSRPLDFGLFTLPAPLSWLTMKRPVLYFVGYTQGNALVGHIYSLGNPVVWWGGSVAAVFTSLTALPSHLETRPRWGLRAFWQWLQGPFEFRIPTAHLFATLLFLGTYLPFFAVQRDQFAFYFLAAAPFLSLTLGGYVGRWWDSGTVWGRSIAVIAFAFALGAFIFYYPVYAGTYITEEDFQFIMRSIPGMTQ